MTRSFGFLALVAVGATQFAGAASFAQTPPSERELRIYAGLHDAAARGNGGRNHTATVAALVEAGADVTLPDRHGTTALQHARTRGYSQIARILENAGAH